MTLLSQLPTPSFLVDLDKLETNIKEMGQLCRLHGKNLWPMTKTHKSTAIAKMQQDSGAAGFLAGTLEEAEHLVSVGIKDIMLAYPLASRENISRAIGLAQNCHLVVSFDGPVAARLWEEALSGADLALEYLIIIDCGLRRFGVQAEQAVELAGELKNFPHLRFKGIATHPGQVYSKSSWAEVETVAAEETQSMYRTRELLEKEGFRVDIAATGSTPTASLAAQNKSITALRPGNYVFYDAMQVALGVVPQDRCALTVLATIISHPREDLLIMDAGSKCFGLDKGAHGTTLLEGFGIIKGHPELLVEGLSEEVGKIKVMGPTSLRVGDKIEVIPNHACSAANMTSHLLGHRKGIVERTLPVDARGGTGKPPKI